MYYTDSNCRVCTQELASLVKSEINVCGRCNQRVGLHTSAHPHSVRESAAIQGCSGFQIIPLVSDLQAVNSAERLRRMLAE